MTITQDNHKRFPIKEKFVSNVFKWNTQLFLFEKLCGVNSLVNSHYDGVG